MAKNVGKVCSGCGFVHVDGEDPFWTERDQGGGFDFGLVEGAAEAIGFQQHCVESMYRFFDYRVHGRCPRFNCFHHSVWSPSIGEYKLCRFYRPDHWDMRCLPCAAETYDGLNLKVKTGTYGHRPAGGAYPIYIRKSKS